MELLGFGVLHESVIVPEHSQRGNRRGEFCSREKQVCGGQLGGLRDPECEPGEVTNLDIERERKFVYVRLWDDDSISDNTSNF